MTHGLSSAAQGNSGPASARQAKSTEARSTQTLEDELDRAFAHIATGALTERNHAIARHYIGLDGDGGATMEVVGQLHNLTRESVRTTIDGVSRRLRHYHSAGGQFPALWRIVSILESEAPVRADVIEQELLDRGLIRHPFRLEGVLGLCEILGHTMVLAPILEFQDQRWLLLRTHISASKKGLYSLIHRTVSAMNKCMSHNGAIYLPLQAQQLQLRSPEQSLRLVEQLAALRPDLRRSASRPGWVWYSDSSRSCLRNRLLKIFSVIESGTLTDIYRGIQRNYDKTRKHDAEMPLPKEVFADILRDMPDIEVDGEQVRCHKRPDADTALIGFEAALIAFITSQPASPIERSTLEQALVKTQQEKYALSMSLGFSCILLNAGSRGYRLVGTPWPSEIAP